MSNQAQNVNFYDDYQTEEARHYIHNASSGLSSEKDLQGANGVRGDHIDSELKCGDANLTDKPHRPSSTSSSSSGPRGQLSEGSQSTQETTQAKQQEKHNNELFSEKRGLVQYIRDSIIGCSDLIDTPYGPRPLLYHDFTASGRVVSFIEDYLRHEVLPLYANTHTLSSATGRQSMLFRQEARDIIANAVHATKDDQVLFAGTGATGAVNLLIHLLGLNNLKHLQQKNSIKNTFSRQNHHDNNNSGNNGNVGNGGKGSSWRVEVIFGPYEHHSNMLPWLEAGCHGHKLPSISPHFPANSSTKSNGIDLNVLENFLKTLLSRDSSDTNKNSIDSKSSGGIHRNHRNDQNGRNDQNEKVLIIGAFSAASNITGKLVDTLGRYNPTII